MTVRLESVTFTSGDGETRVPSYLATPDRDGPHPTVLILRGVAGPDDGYTEIARRLAEWGYYVVSHDRYHRAEPWYTMKSRDDDEVKKMFGLVLGTTEDEVAEDLTALLAWLPSDPAARGGAMGCIGYCIGARSALSTLRDRGEQFRAGVGLHPSFCTTDGTSRGQICNDHPSTVADDDGGYLRMAATSYFQAPVSLTDVVTGDQGG